MGRNYREEIRRYEGDVYYEAWRRGMNPDNAVECAQDCYWEGRTPDECVSAHAPRRSYSTQSQMEDAYMEQAYAEYCAQMEAEYLAEMERQERDAAIAHGGAGEGEKK